MRDPARIEPFLDTLKEAWEKVPDWRFMQLVNNMQRSMGDDGFYLEDNECLDFIKQAFEIN